MFHQGDNRGFDLINHAIRMGAAEDVLGLRNAELLRHLTGADTAGLLVRAGQVQPPPRSQPSTASATSVHEANLTKEATWNSNSFQFPHKLHQMLDAAAQEGLEDIVSWQDDGMAFRVHIPPKFVELIMPRYFKQTKYKSFQRQLNLYGFTRVNGGASKGGYKHFFFQRGKRNLCQQITRNNGVDGMPAGADICRIPTDANEQVGPGSPVESFLSPREGTSPLVPLAQAASILTPKSMVPLSSPNDNVAVSVSSNSSAGDAERSETVEEYPGAKGGAPIGLHLRDVEFPRRVHRMLELSEEDSFEHIVSWQPGGICFRVHNPSSFVDSILPRFFRQTKYKSFQRQLNIYGFTRVENGPNKGSYRHSFFVREGRDLLSKIVRVKRGKLSSDESSQEDAGEESSNTIASSMHPRRSSGIPAILAAIECAEAMADGDAPLTRLSTPSGPSWRHSSKLCPSDCIVEVVEKKTKEKDVYHLHRGVLTSGSRRSELFARMFERRLSTSNLVIELGEAEARVFPFALDYIYMNSELDVSPETAYALYSLADQLEITPIITILCDYYVSNMTKENVVEYLAMGGSFCNKMLREAAVEKCAELLRSMDQDSAKEIDPELFLSVIQRSRSLAKKHRSSSNRLSQLVAACLEAHPFGTPLQFFYKLTDKEFLPYIDSVAGIKLLAVEQQLRDDDITHVDQGHCLRERCLTSIVSNWGEMKKRLRNDQSLAVQIKALPSYILFDILMRTDRFLS